MQVRKSSLAFLSFFAVLALAGLACAQAGKILSDAEATAEALPTPTVVVDLSDVADFQNGQVTTIVGGDSGALVPLYANPGARFFSSQVLHGEEVTILATGIDEDGGLWYEVDGLAGRGWTTTDHLEPVEIDLSEDASLEE